MKRVKNITMAVLVTVIGTGWAMAQGVSTGITSMSDPHEVQVVSRADARYKLVYPFKKTEMVWIRIYDSEQHLLLSEKVKNQDGFMKSYDFSNLSEGLYTINIQSKSGTIRKEVYHKYQHKDIDVAVEKYPDNNSYHLVVKGVKRDPVYVDILDAQKETIFEDVVDVGKNFSREYKFEEKLPDIVTFRVSTKDQSIEKEVK